MAKGLKTTSELHDVHAKCPYMYTVKQSQSGKFVIQEKSAVSR